MVGMLIVGSYSIGYHFYRLECRELGLASVAVTWPLVMMFGAVGDMLGNRCGNYYRPVERQRQPAAGTAQPRQHAGLAGIVQPDDDCRQTFSDRYTRLFGATDELMPGAVRYSRILIYGNLAYMLVTGVLAVIRNDGRPVLSMLMVGGLLLNIVMDYVFIFPLGGGVAGAAYATVTVRC